ncbi:hypothetical protein AAG570_009791 [Ranatra chinensis]|uniref:Uncharacterized protein n=1 Tax=Ranatra chinensis TaxID=642074 RepID=A0ABD0YQQ2_9HEMI
MMDGKEGPDAQKVVRLEIDSDNFSRIVEALLRAEEDDRGVIRRGQRVEISLEEKAEAVSSGGKRRRIYLSGKVFWNNNCGCYRKALENREAAHEDVVARRGASRKSMGRIKSESEPGTRGTRTAEEDVHGVSRPEDIRVDNDRYVYISEKRKIREREAGRDHCDNSRAIARKPCIEESLSSLNGRSGRSGPSGRWKKPSFLPGRMDLSEWKRIIMPNGYNPLTWLYRNYSKTKAFVREFSTYST